MHHQKIQTGWVDTKIRPIYMLSSRDPLQILRHLYTGSKRIGKGTSSNRNQRKAGLAMLIQDKIDFKTDYYMRQRRILYNDQEFNSEESITIINTYAPNI